MNGSDKKEGRNAPAMREAYTIRRALVGDLEKLPAIEAAAGLRFRETAHPEAADDPVYSVDRLAKAAEKGSVWVACLDEEPVGFAVVAWLDDQAHLDEMDVLPDHGRRGLGAELLAAARAWAAAQGARELTLTTYDDVAWNRAFYERNGFEVIAADSIRPGLAERMREEGDLGSNVARVAMSCSLAAGKGDPA